MKLNLGCGNDVRDGYVNVDIVTVRNDITHVDLSKFPWPWDDSTVSEVLMLDFLEHFPYRQTDAMLQEAWRVMRLGAEIFVQVPDFEHCAAAALGDDCLCNVCGRGMWQETKKCECGATREDIADAAIRRLYGGQDYEGNFHFNAFTEERLRWYLERNGFGDVEYIEKNENGETYYQNWNIKARAVKKDDLWD